MYCPKCKTTELKESPIQGLGVKLDRCPGCRGFWFEESELELLLGNKAVKPFGIPAFATRDANKPCPKCLAALYEFCYPGTNTRVDACNTCLGVWLDNEEWQSIGSARGAENEMACPKCGKQQPHSEQCVACGIFFKKYYAQQNAR